MSKPSIKTTKLTNKVEADLDEQKSQKVDEKKHEKKHEEKPIKRLDVSDSEDEETVETVKEEKNPQTEQKTSESEDSKSKKKGAGKGTTSGKPDKKKQRQQVQEQVCHFINNLPTFVKQLEDNISVFKKLCDKIRNKKFTSIKSEKIAVKKQCYNKLHPCIAAFAAQYELDPNESYDAFTIVGKIKKYICKAENKFYFKEQNSDSNKSSSILRSRVDIESSPVLKGTFGKMIELMKNSEEEIYRNAAKECKLSNIQTFCSILQHVPKVKLNAKKEPIKLSAAQQAKEDAKKKILDGLAA